MSKFLDYISEFFNDSAQPKQKEKPDKYYYANLVALKTYFKANRDTIQPKLNMKVFRDLESYTSVDCKTCGCILGHAISMPRFQKFIRIDCWLGSINFASFSLKAFNIREDSLGWNYLFGTKNPNSVDKFIERLERYLKTTDLKPN